MTDTSHARQPAAREHIPRRVEELYSAELDGETVIFSEATGELTLLDAVGTVVWNLLDGVSSVGEISHELADAFGAPVEQVQQDVAAMVSHLEGMQLVTPIPAGDA